LAISGGDNLVKVMEEDATGEWKEVLLANDAQE
jgi:hypothetical protein